ncbi:hypothetical protein LJB81_01540 [Desulfovibrio sp. OttesenSCG-928-M14]|nr:hypothetical protein [Desulfovibrio sp. OttesenSCG-928-M14]
MNALTFFVWLALRSCALCLLCLGFLFDAGGHCAQAASSPSATMPLKTNIGPKNAPAQVRAAPSAVEKKRTQHSGIDGFCANPFALEHKMPGAQNATANGITDKSRLIYGKKEDNVKPVTVGGDDRVSVSAKSKEAPDDRLTPRRSVFPGGEQTLSRMDTEHAPEVGLHYKLNKNATTSFVVNPQDEGSPLPRPAEPEGNINAAGLYMQVDVAPDVTLRLGGEYCDIDDPRASNSDASRGVSAGFQWNF